MKFERYDNITSTYWHDTRCFMLSRQYYLNLILSQLKFIFSQHCELLVYLDGGQVATTTIKNKELNWTQGMNGRRNSLQSSEEVKMLLSPWRKHTFVHNCCTPLPRLVPDESNRGYRLPWLVSTSRTVDVLLDERDHQRMPSVHIWIWILVWLQISQ